VLANLIANGLRYSPRGGMISIGMRAQPEAAPVAVQVCVQDNGPGIPEADLPQIFNRFYKSRDSGGMGLGLPIARFLVEAHGGEIRAENLPAGGTRITFSLPRYAP